MGRYAVAGYLLGAIALPAVAYLWQPEHCFRHLYAPVVVPLFVLLCLLAGAAQWLWGAKDVASVAYAAAFAVGIQFTMLVPCMSDIEDSSRVRLMASASLFMGAVAGAGLATFAISLLRSSSVRDRWRVLAAVGAASAGCVVVAGATAVYLGTVSEHSTWMLSMLAAVNSPSTLLATEATLAVAVGGALLARRANGR